jgi:hypothetical protein
MISILWKFRTADSESLKAAERKKVVLLPLQFLKKDFYKKEGQLIEG